MPFVPVPDSQRRVHIGRGDNFDENDQRAAGISETTLRIRAQAFGSFMAMRARQLYDRHVDTTLKSFGRGVAWTWQWYTTAWHWPLPP